MINIKTGVLSNHQTTVSLITRIVDVININSSLYIVFILNGVSITNNVWLLMATTVIVFHAISEMNSLYVSWRGETVRKEIGKLTLVWLLTLAVVVLTVNFVYSLNHVSSAMLIQWAGLTLMSFYFYRISIRLVLRELRRHGHNTRSVAIVGAGDLGVKISEQLLCSPWMGLKLRGFFDDNRSGEVVVLARLCAAASQSQTTAVRGQQGPIFKHL